MPAPVDWYDEDRTIVKVTITQGSTWEEYYQVIEWIVREVKQVDHRVEIIFHDDVGMPRSNPLPHLKWGTQKIIDLPNAGHTFIAGSQGTTNTFARMIMAALGKMFLPSSLQNDPNRQLIFLPSLEAAIAQIEKERGKSIVTKSIVTH